MKKSSLKKIVITAMFAALIAVMTAFIKIPIGANGGYVHLGDSMIYLAGCLLGPYAAIAASIGGALEDILAGAAIWAIPTAIIKPINSIPFIIATAHYVKKKGCHKIIHPSTVLMTVISGLITIFGYYIAEGLMFSFEAALISSWIGIIQPVGGAVIFIVVGCALDKIKIQKYLD
ncbi:MAG: TIGR04002 family protein [Clostridia bacterium]|nr:TIGR04002 family protein [Clostridia bacterium]MEE1184826.1 TIGR04002 family protein [Acutalibacteraceae bacterium]